MSREIFVFFPFFWKSYQYAYKMGVRRKNAAVFDRRNGICYDGDPLAGAEPRQYVPGRWGVFPAAGKTGSVAAPAGHSPSWAGRKWGDYRSGVADRPDIQSKIQGLGLPPDAHEFPGSGVYPIFGFVDTPESGGNAAAPTVGAAAIKKGDWATSHRDLYGFEKIFIPTENPSSLKYIQYFFVL